MSPCRLSCLAVCLALVKRCVLLYGALPAFHDIVRPLKALLAQHLADCSRPLEIQVRLPSGPGWGAGVRALRPWAEGPRHPGGPGPSARPARQGLGSGSGLRGGPTVLSKEAGSQEGCPRLAWRLPRGSTGSALAAPASQWVRGPVAPGLPGCSPGRAARSLRISAFQELTRGVLTDMEKQPTRCRPLVCEKSKPVPLKLFTPRLVRV